MDVTTVVLECPDADEVNIGASYAFDKTGPWVGPIEISTHPGDGEATGTLKDGDEIQLARAYESYPVLVRVRVESCDPVLCGTIKSHHMLVARRKGTKILLPNLTELETQKRTRE